MECRNRDYKNNVYSYNSKKKPIILQRKKNKTNVKKEEYSFLEKFFTTISYKDCSYMNLIQSIISVNISPINKMYIQYIDYTLIGDFPKKIITITTPTKTIIHEENESNNEWKIYCK